MGEGGGEGGRVSMRRREERVGGGGEGMGVRKGDVTLFLLLRIHSAQQLHTETDRKYDSNSK